MRDGDVSCNVLPPPPSHNLNPLTPTQQIRTNTSSLPRRKSKTPTTPTSGVTSPPTWNTVAPANTLAPSSKRHSKSSSLPARPPSFLSTALQPLLPLLPPMEPTKPTRPSTRRITEMTMTLRELHTLPSRPHSEGRPTYIHTACV